MNRENVVGEAWINSVIQNSRKSVESNPEPKLLTINHEFKADKTAKAEENFDVGISKEFFFNKELFFWLESPLSPVCKLRTVVLVIVLGFLKKQAGH